MSENKNITLNLHTAHATYLESVNSDDLDFIIRTGIYTLNESKKLAKTGGIIPAKRTRNFETSESSRLIRRMLTMNNRDFRRPKYVQPITKSIETISNDLANFKFEFAPPTFGENKTIQ